MKHPRYFLLLLSPVTWFKCFSLVFYRTRARKRSIAVLQFAILLMAVSCYLSYVLADDAGQYSLYLSDVASNTTSMIEGRRLFDDLIWRTVLKTFFLGIIFGLIQACTYFLAAQWRQQLCDHFQQLLIRSPNECVLYDMVQTNENIYKVITNDIKQFTSSFASILFGCLFFKSIISMFALIVTACVFILRAANGNANGILICFLAFIFCVLIGLPSAQLYSWNLITQSKVKGRLRSYIQRIQSHAQCIVLYGSQHVELKYIQQLISSICNSLFIGSISFILINFPIQLSYSITGICTYTLPSIVFFFIQKVQSPELAKNLLTVIPFYSLLINLLSQLIFIMEFALVTVTMGDHLWTKLNHLEKLTKQHEKRIIDEQQNGIRREDSNMFILHHLNISLDVGLLQKDINLEAKRGQCILISGPSGCGKTSLFRICAGLQTIDAKHIILPARHHLLFIPQRPYLPIGSLRCQALFLLKDTTAISDKHLFQLFQSVHLFYLIQRYTLDTVADWSTLLSTGEQQRLSFIRLFAFFTLPSNKEQLAKETLVFLDESTSAIDVQTEYKIYLQLTQLHVWFVTISHRSSLKNLHAKYLEFSPEGYRYNSIDKQHEDNKIEEQEETNEQFHAPIDHMPGIFEKKNTSQWKSIIDIFKFMHLPFQSDDTKLKIQTFGTWLVTLIMVSIATWTFYAFIDQTATLYNGLSAYASGTVSLAETKQLIKSGIINYILIVVAAAASYSFTAGGGRLLASLYTRRQMNYVSHFLLNANNLLYHSRHMLDIPNILSHDIAELNTEVFNILFGHIYYVGIISQFSLNIILSIVLSKQNGGSIGNLIVYIVAFGFFFITMCICAISKKWLENDENQFIQFLNAHKRVELQAEQIALSGEDVCRSEEANLRQKLDTSIRSQIVSGYLISIIVGIARLSVESCNLISYGIPAAIFFHIDSSQGAQTFIALTVYISNLYASASFITYFSDPLRRIHSIGIRVVNNLEQLRRIDMYYRCLANEEQERRRRVYIEPKSNEPSLVLEQIDVRIPHTSQILISNVNLILNSSDNLLITGPSGCGKSSILRLLAGLTFNECTNNNSVLRIIPRQNIIILSQQLHLTQGTLREQLSYLRLAHGLESMKDDHCARKILEELNLSHLIDRYSLDGEGQIWSEILSIGEQQRLMMATAFLVGTETIRLFILDETTSGCDKQTEKAIYEHLQRSNKLFSIILDR